MATAFVLINTEPALMTQVLEKIKAVEGVKEAEMVYGVYDIIAKVEAENMDQLKNLIAYRIRLLANVRSTQTMLVTSIKNNQ